MTCFKLGGVNENRAAVVMETDEMGGGQMACGWLPVGGGSETGGRSGLRLAEEV